MNIFGDVEITAGAAGRIIEIYEPGPFDIYYFAEKDSRKDIRRNGGARVVVRLF